MTFSKRAIPQVFGALVDFFANPQLFAFGKKEKLFIALFTSDFSR